MEQDSVDLSAESLYEAIEKVRVMRDSGVLSANPSIAVGTMAQAAALAAEGSDR